MEQFSTNRLKAAINAKEWRVAQLHAAMIRAGSDITGATLYNWINGTTAPSAKDLPFLAKALGKRVSYFFVNEKHQTSVV